MNTRLPLALFSCAAATVSGFFSNQACAARAPSDVTVVWTPEKTGSANAAILAYLGEPVPPPAELDPKYTSDGLVAAFKTVCANLGIEVNKLAVNDNEFPFLLYGVLGGGRDFQSVQNALRALPGYAYGGSVVVKTNGVTYFSLNMMSPDQYPRAQRQAIQRRLMIRLQMLGATWADSAH